MHKQDFEFLTEILNSDSLRNKTVYIDDVNSGIKDAVFFISQVPFDMSVSQEEAVNKKFESIIDRYKSKSNEFNQRFVDEYTYNRDKYLERLNDQYNAFKNVNYTTTLNDDCNSVIIFLNKNQEAKKMRNATVLMREELGSTVLPYKLFAVRDKYVWTSNKNLDIKDLMLVLDLDKNMDTEDLPYQTLDVNYYPQATDELRLCILNPKQTARFRQLKTHRFVGTSSSSSVGVLINNQLAGVIGYNQCFTTFYGSFDEDELFLQFSIACTPLNKKVRMGKLIDKISLWDKTAKIMLNDYEKIKYTKIVSTSITPYPECKHARRLMKLKSKKFDEKTGMYNLVYGCEMTHQKDLKEIFFDWIKKENL